MKLIYLASPYTHADKSVECARFEAVCKVAARMMREGQFVFSPIAHTHPIALAGELPGDWHYFAAYDELIISRCDELHVLMLDGWTESVGVAAEVAIALRMGKTVRYVQQMSYVELEVEIERLPNISDGQDPIGQQRIQTDMDT